MFMNVSWWLQNRNGAMIVIIIRLNIHENMQKGLEYLIMFGRK